MFLGKGIFIHNTFLIKFGQELDIALEYIRGRNIGQLIVDNCQFGSIIIIDIKVRKQEIRFYNVCSGERNLIVGIAVSVGILFFEGFQYIIELIQIFRFFQSQVVHPSLVDPVGGYCTFLSSDLRKRIDMAISRGQIFPCVSFVENLGQIRCVLSDQIFQRKEEALTSIFI